MNIDNPQLGKVQKDFVQDLLRHISEEDYNELVKEFINDTRIQLKTLHLESFLEEKTRTVRAVHSIKGNALSLGFNHLSSYAADFEELLKSYSGEINSDIFVNFRKSTEEALMYIGFFNE